MRLLLSLAVALAAATGCGAADAGSTSEPHSVGSPEFETATSFWRSDIGDCQLAARVDGDFTLSGSAEPNPFPYGSITKTFTAVLVLKLVELGKLSLDDSIAKFGLNIPGDRSITVRDLLTHESGLPEYFYSVDPAKPPASGQILAMIQGAAANKTLPKGSFHYANTNYWLLSAICEKVTGEPFGTAMQRYVCTPIGISAHPESRPTFDLNWYGGAGNLTGSIEDLTAFGEAVADRDRRLLSPESWKLLASPQVSMDASGHDRYGFGVIVAKMAVYPVLTHGGEIPENGGEPPYVSMLIVRQGGPAHVSFAAFGRNAWTSKSLNALYGAFASVCATEDTKVWIKRLTSGLTPDQIQAYVNSGALSPDLAALMTPQTLDSLRKRLGTLSRFSVTAEQANSESISLEGDATGSAGQAHVSAQFGKGGRLESLGLR